MKNLEEIKNIIQHKKPILIKKHKIKDIGIFGSYVRGEQRLNSDIDILIGGLVGLKKFRAQMLRKEQKKN